MREESGICIGNQRERNETEGREGERQLSRKRLRSGIASASAFCCCERTGNLSSVDLMSFDNSTSDQNRRSSNLESDIIGASLRTDLALIFFARGRQIVECLGRIAHRQGAGGAGYMSGRGRSLSCAVSLYVDRGMFN